MTVAEAAIAAHLAAWGLGTVGSTLFINQKPGTPDNLMCVFGYAGSAPERTHDTSGNSHPGIQVWVRDTSATTGRTRIESVFNLLDGSGNFSVSSVRIVELNAVQSPMPMGKDENGRYEYAVNFSTSIIR